MDAILNELISASQNGQIEQRADGYWIEAAGADPREIAGVMKAYHARLSTVTAVNRADGETDLIYHFFLPKKPINVRVTTREQRLPSVATILPAANWIEREIHDLFAVQFDGHPDLRRLVRPPEMPEGFYRQPGGAAARTERTA
ncbi:MAG TPA: NADH-quinone oxidoreductase subunit C [Anaerolineaceae bacterium]|nr:NADH-quinone oxidoreductase subunit C [Anaerolineaceae bacterium]